MARKLKVKHKEPIYKCINCGDCCRREPCRFGHGYPCVELSEDNKCNKYEYIKNEECKGYFDPFFGEGCCFPRSDSKDINKMEIQGWKVLIGNKLHIYTSDMKLKKVINYKEILKKLGDQ